MRARSGRSPSPLVLPHAASEKRSYVTLVRRKRRFTALPFPIDFQGEKNMKWILTAFVSVTFAVLSFNAFIANDLSKGRSENAFIGMMTGVYGWLLSSIGSMPSGIVFALCAIGILLLAVLDGRGAKKSDF